MIITEILARNARMYTHEDALIERTPAENKRLTISWRQFDEQANRMAQALISMGVAKGDRVAQLMTNCIEYLPIYFGILRAGALSVPLNFRFEAETIANCMALAEAKVLIFGEEFIERIDRIKSQLDKTVEAYIFTGPEARCPAYAKKLGHLLQSQPDGDPQVPLELTDDAALYFTSGTTGTPKGVLLSHKNLEAACIVENHHHRQTHTDNFLCIPPLYHTGATIHWFGNLIVGAKAVILKGVEPRWIIEAVSEERVTLVWLLVPWALDILFAIESGDLKLKNYELDQWRLMHIGAQPVPPSLVKEWQKVFSHHQFDNNYGLTETTGPGCVHMGVENTHKIGAIGLSGFDWEHRIVDNNFEEVAAGMPGELIVKGPGVMRGYYRNPESTAQTLKDGWLCTGDIARRDEDGFIWLVDRKKDVIITGGENVYPVEIEDFLQTHPDIQDVAVIGLPSLRLGEIATAIIQLKPGRSMDKETIKAYCAHLPRYKRPRKIYFGNVPRNATGKILKPQLREEYGGIKESFKIE